jgi:hypothetical protein
MPQNSEYLMLGLMMTFGLLGIFAASVFLRFRHLRREIRLIEEDK